MSQQKTYCIILDDASIQFIHCGGAAWHPGELLVGTVHG
jgi:hypothetical protein